MRVVLSCALIVLLRINVYSQWQPASGGSLGEVTAFGGDYSTQYGVTGGRLYQIKGRIWSPLSNSPTRINNFVTIGKQIVAATLDQGIYRSTDVGVTWVKSNTGLTNLATYIIIQSGSELFVGTNGGGVFTSSDGGVSWFASNSGLGSHYISSLAVSGTYLAAGTDAGVFLSTDNGNHWSSTGILPDPYVSCVGITGHFILAGTIDGIDGGLFSSTDLGASWKRADTGITNKKIHAIAFTTAGEYIGTENGLYQRMGAVWSEVDGDLSGAWVDAIALVGFNLFVGTTMGAFVSSDGGSSWANTNTSGPALNVMAIGTLAVNGDTLIACGGGRDRSGSDDWNGSGVFQSVNDGLSWKSTSEGLPSNTPINALDAHGPTWYVATDSGVYRSNNRGINWTAVDSGLRALLPYPAISAITSIGSTVIAGRRLVIGSDGNNRLLRSTDEGNRWLPLQNDPLSISSELLATIGSDIYAGTEDQPSCLWLSKDSGKSWSPVGGSIPGDGFDAILQLGSKVFAAAYYGQHHVFWTTDEGSTWTDVTSNLPTGIQVQSLATDGVNLFLGAFQYPGTAGGIYFSTDEGATWRQANNGLADIDVLSVAVHGSTLFAGTKEAGVWSRSISEMIASVSVAVHSAPSSSVICYPNPLNNSTTVNLRSCESGFATITVVNLLGEEASCIFSGNLQPGEHTFVWNASGIPPGVYECLVRMNGEVKHVPLVVR